ncbi:1-deoxy-D-xylulose-5-phosphate synthase [Frankliniella fusca]|uniref:1-deoxy-D-xylulose-5-phosphate synthase n=1 Tax=Frankliniella fusca TaxID=407009 RepID=A0AAE1H4J3_9NEOP|nr:1-deoxy-D-xylulose-5-phosphate synthase [Frankliniella fusca]
MHVINKDFSTSRLRWYQRCLSTLLWQRKDLSHCSQKYGFTLGFPRRYLDGSGKVFSIFLASWSPAQRITGHTLETQVSWLTSLLHADILSSRFDQQANSPGSWTKLALKPLLLKRIQNASLETCVRIN